MDEGPTLRQSGLSPVAGCPGASAEANTKETHTRTHTHAVLLVSLRHMNVSHFIASGVCTLSESVEHEQFVTSFVAVLRLQGNFDARLSVLP